MKRVNTYPTNIFVLKMPAPLKTRYFHGNIEYLTKLTTKVLTCKQPSRHMMSKQRRIKVGAFPV